MHKSPWLKPAIERRRIVEQLLGQNLPQNFPVIDKAVRGANNIAQSITSIKSTDLKAVTYQHGNALYNRIMMYARQLQAFRGQTWGSTTVNINDATQPVTLHNQKLKGA
ncbi:MAG: hypothetical protein FWC16_00130 [Defluviitaleaceae bacterium]|nr:hypothetical protein [Defluviitaleaceae bacterium]MCL2273309.1 hypothetical protein [Defluviitaleaceae bacterium]